MSNQPLNTLSSTSNQVSSSDCSLNSNRTDSSSQLNAYPIPVIPIGDQQNQQVNISKSQQTPVLSPMQQALATLSAEPTSSSLGMLDLTNTLSSSGTQQNSATTTNNNTITQIHGLNLQLPLLGGTAATSQQFQNPLSIPPPNQISDETVAQIVTNNSVPEFLYQLTKMLTDDHRDVIEWSNGKIYSSHLAQNSIEVSFLISASS